VYIIGIDCGLTGGVGVLWGSKFSAVYDTPTLTVKAFKGTRHEYDLGGMAKMLQHYTGLTYKIQVFVEEAQSMPKQGVRSTFTTGLGFGAWLGILAALGIPYTRVRPTVWKRALGLGRDKEHCRLRAQQLFPLADLHRKGDHGRAEALLLAWYGLHELAGRR
jgi:crossover junction endodeoxyribonuclease RuvC